MRWLIGVVCLMAVILESAVVLRPEEEPSPLKGNRLATLREELRTKEPEIVLVGNSLLLDSTDEDLLTALTGRRSLIVGCSGSASAWWYLALKNVLLDSQSQWTSRDSRPSRRVIVFFRDYALTDPGFRVTGQYQSALDEISMAEEPVLEALAYRSTMGRLDHLLFRHCPLYQRRQAIRERLNSRIRDDMVPFLTGIAGDTEGAIGRVFAEGNLDDELVTTRQLASASRPSGNACDFKRQLDRSFLPHMISLAQANGVQIVFVRMKRRRDTVPNCEPPGLQRYIRDLETYLTANRVPLLDFTHEPRITLDLYGAGDHLCRTPAVRRHFTELLAQRLAPMLTTNEQAGQ